MKEAKITLRQKEILNKICSEYKYVTVSSIADSIGTSSRTILRELSDIENWIKAYNCSLDKRAGIGIRLKGSLEDRSRIIKDLQGKKEIKNYTPRERQVIVLSEILQSREPVKIYSFTRTLNVTEGTVSHDLDKVEEWLKDYNLKLIRKPGLGIYLEGEEKAIRKAIVNLIYENVDDYQLINMIIGNAVSQNKIEEFIGENTKNILLNLIDKKTIRKLEALIFELQDMSGYKLTDNAYIGLLIHLTLAVQRIRKNEKISIDNNYLKELKTYREYSTAADLTKKISEAFDIEIPEDETGYITMHLRGSKGFENDYERNIKNKEELWIEDLAKDMLKMAEIETGLFLEYNERVLIGLVNHLGPAINRLKMNLDIRNPLLKEIKDFYPELFKLASKCVKILESRVGITMPDSEIGYIAMHLGAAMETGKETGRRIYKVAVACASGIGTSRLLAAKIEKEYDNIKVAEVIPTLHIYEKLLTEKKIDFIISTVPVKDCPIPVVQVNPLLFPKDMEKIEELIKNLKHTPVNYSTVDIKQLNLTEKLSKLMVYMDGILQVLNNFFLYEYEKVHSILELIEQVSSKLSLNEEEKKAIELSLKEREEKGSTVLTGLKGVLLHCRTSGVKQLYFGIVRIKEGLYHINAEEEKEKIEFAIIMLAPENCDKAYIEVMGYISTMIIEKPEFLEALQSALKEDIYVKLNNILDEFYKAKSS